MATAVRSTWFHRNPDCLGTTTDADAGVEHKQLATNTRDGAGDTAKARLAWCGDACAFD
jgi:hypothetical protein